MVCTIKSVESSRVKHDVQEKAVAQIFENVFSRFMEKSEASASDYYQKYSTSGRFRFSLTPSLKTPSLRVAVLCLLDSKAYQNKISRFCFLKNRFPCKCSMDWYLG